MSLRAQRNFCLLAIAGVLWTGVVLWVPISRWQDLASAYGEAEVTIGILVAQEEARVRAVPDAQEQSGRKVPGFCFTGSILVTQEKLRPSAPPANWKDRAIALVVPGVLAVVVGLVGSAIGLVTNGSGSGFRPSKGTHGFPAHTA